MHFSFLDMITALITGAISREQWAANPPPTGHERKHWLPSDPVSNLSRTFPFKGKFMQNDTRLCECRYAGGLLCLPRTFLDLCNLGLFTGSWSYVIMHSKNNCYEATGVHYGVFFELLPNITNLRIYSSG